MKMNTGIIANRYGKALLKLVQETGSGKKVLSQVKVLSMALSTVPDFRKTVESPAVPTSLKLPMFRAALAPEALAPDLERFIDLLARNERLNNVFYIFNSFVRLWYDSLGILSGRLTLPYVDANTSTLVEDIRSIIHNRTGKDLELEVVVDREIIGGFRLKVEDRLLDASVSHQLDIIRRQFMERNRRLV